MPSSISSIISSLTTTDLTIVVLGLSIAHFLYRSGTGKPFPPGPMRLPIVGNMFVMPKKEEWITYEKWANEYGPITYLSVFGSPIVVFNTWRTVKDLMDERSANYSNRPSSAWNELCQLTWIVTFANGEAHRIRRGMVQRYFSGPAALKHRVHQQEEACVLLANLIRHPDVPLEKHIKQHAASSILLGAYGYRVPSADDALVKEVDRSFEYGNQGATLSSILLDMFPSLKDYPYWMPFSGFRRFADVVKQVFAEVRLDPYKRSRKMIDEGTAKPCFVSTSIGELESESLPPNEAGQKEDLIIDCAAVMYGAGVDSTTASMGSFFALMALHPAILQKAQAEIDSVTNGERLPTFEDKESLPYLNAIYLEVLRHNTVTPLCLPHQIVKDDMYHDVFLPGGAMALGNMWLIFRDPEIFTDPHDFKPERFLDKVRGPQCREVLNIVWGFGRRACPGRQLAEASLFISMASVAACFDIKPSTENPKLEYTSGFVRRPILFPMLITPRSEKHKEFIEIANLAHA